ncbi:MAG: L-2-amino-thiazoline-4-carboxylic acid hydrolase [Deltaproteobacteria bacterium]|nr:L-2-amino-thiazoline-4-carboxylic acid hydrolase [Deltaproteobacteria bacterium]
MNDLEREKKKGLNFFYLAKGALKRLIAGKKYHTPGFGLGSQLFSTMAKHIIEKLGPEEGEALIKQAVESFGRERGKRIAEVVQNKGKPLSLANWLIYTDISSKNFGAKPSLPDGDLEAKVGNCIFYNAAEKWGLGEYAKLYCKYADYAILDGYNPDVKLLLEQRQKTGKDHCLFRYIMKEENK